MVKPGVPTARPARARKLRRATRRRRVPLQAFVIAYVWARAAGRCEFRGCNAPLWKDLLTTKEANVGKLAHIVAASPDGPRGDPIESRKLETDPANIMLLCGTHHDLVDSKKHAASYRKDLLCQQKTEHESRIERLTAIAENQKSIPILVQIPVGAYVLRTPAPELSQAIAADGLYPDDARKVRIDLNGMTGRDHDPAFWQEAQSRLADELTRQLRSLEHDGPLQHASVFAFGPMPLLVFLGHLFDEKMATRVYNRIRSPSGWAWPNDGRRITKFTVRAPRSCKAGADVALKISVTSKVQTDHVRKCIGPSMPAFELGWSNPNLDCLRSPSDLAEFVVAARDVMERIHRARPSRVHVFPAVPVAAAVEFGRSLQKKLHPPMVLYDFHQASGGWRRAFELATRAV